MTTFDGGEEARLSEIIAPAFHPVHRDIRAGSHTHYWLSGGRGSGKSSFAALEVVLGVMRHEGASALVLRKVRDTVRESVRSQLSWAVGRLGAGGLWDMQGERLRYRPNGGCILLRGLDRAEKLKSIRPPAGYFRYVWFEELAEFSGMGEVRSVLQSALRGGERFCCLYTYNPPRSRRHWVNAEALAGAPGRLVHESDYRAMPPGWLGEEFLAEARRLSLCRPEAYEHEYLGKAVGLGTEVFGNVAARPITEEEIARFGRVRRGLDFGYASDPAHYVVCHYDAARRKLYLFAEERLRRTSNAVLAERILEEMRLHGRGRVCCDSADPRSIDELYLRGVPVYGARKGPGSVEWGMKFLSAEVEEIIIDPARCPYALREFTAYELPVDGNGDAVPQYPDRDNHSIDAVRYALEDAIPARPPKEPPPSAGTAPLV